MKMYGRKFASRAINKRTNLRTESRDAVLWTVDWTNRICNVKIQGSDELVTAHFPQNEARLMSFMREGNAVRIVHRGGIRGYMEVVGHGMAIPTPVAGEFHPTISDLPDGITEGGQIIPTDPASMSVTILDGYYRIDGVLYTLSGGVFGEVVTSEDSEITTNETYEMMVTDDPYDYLRTDEDSEILTDEFFPAMLSDDPIGDYELDAAPTGNKFRYDCFYVGVDGVITYLKGTAASSSPAKPTVPTDNVLIGEYILLWTGVTEVTGQHIGTLWETPYASGVEIAAIDEFDWDAGDSTPETNVVATVNNQYDWAISGTYNIALHFLLGSGQLYSADTGWDEDAVSQDLTGSSYTFKYQRNQLISETSPYLMVTVTDGGSLFLYNYHRITLMSILGTEIEGSEVHSQRQTLTPGATVAVDWDDGHIAEVEVDQDTTFTFSISPADYGQDKLILLIEQDDTGGWTPTMPVSVKFGNEIEDASIDETANKRSYLGFIYHPGSSSYDLVAKATGYPAA